MLVPRDLGGAPDRKVKELALRKSMIVTRKSIQPILPKSRGRPAYKHPDASSAVDVALGRKRVLGFKTCYPAEKISV